LGIYEETTEAVRFGPKFSTADKFQNGQYFKTELKRKYL